MTRLLAIALPAMLLGLCLMSAVSADDAPAKETDEPKPITPEEPIDLFNGKDLSNWTYDFFAEDAKPSDIFRVEDGVIKNAGRPVAVLRTKASYADYEIEVQWRWPGKGGNSGLLIHCSTPRERNIWPKSLEVQLAANNAGDFWVIGEAVKVKDAETRTKGRRTINYTDGSEHELGEWNTMIVQAHGDRVKVFVNGTLVNEAWGCSASSGAICLQAEGTPIEYRKVQLRPLPKAVE
ncbi:MAG: DUF1080 domain-containing protein [Phycisphaeraceae bacterium]